MDPSPFSRYTFLPIKRNTDNNQVRLSETWRNGVRRHCRSLNLNNPQLIAPKRPPGLLGDVSKGPCDVETEGSA